MSSVVLRFLCVCVLLAAGCAAQSVASPESFSFAIIGDAPYKPREEPAFERMMDTIDREDVAFTLHVGDIGAGRSACSDGGYDKHLRRLDRSRHPLVYTPGDNEWVDCRNMGFDPLERLARLRTVFFGDELSLGRTRLKLDVQSDDTLGCGAYPENRAFTRAGVRFVTINVPGSNNNMGVDRASDDEARCRGEANRRWLSRAVAASLDRETRALVIVMQANPWRTTRNVYDDVLAAIRSVARALPKPVLLVHGDTHTYRVDAPFTDAVGQPVANITRVETYGSPIVGWVKVTVDPAGPQVFTFAPHITAIVP
ncbi:MAG TPA: hypothetical protein VM051_07675 [Usitatibacter sp.]|nr:hypothetical protein [Usitatibacter sp.]